MLKHEPAPPNLLIGYSAYEDLYRVKLDVLEEALSARGESEKPLVITVAVHFQNTCITQGCIIDMVRGQ